MTHLELPEKEEQSSKKRKRREEKSRKFEELKERKNRRGRVLLLEWKSSSSNVLDHVRGSAEGTRLWTLFFCFRFLTQRERDSERARLTLNRNSLMVGGRTLMGLDHYRASPNFKSFSFTN